MKQSRKLNEATSRTSTDGEWSSIILNFSGRKRICLGQLFPSKDWRQLSRLIVKTYNCLAARVNVFSKSELNASDYSKRPI